MKSDLTYERLSRGEVSLPLDEQDQERLAALEASDAEFLSRHPALPVRKRPITRWSGLAAALVLTVGLGGLLLPPAHDTRMKSAELSLFVYHKTATGTELLGSSAQLAQNDEIQVAYFSSQKRFATILSVDGRGSVTTHLPLHSSQALEVNTTKPELLPYSYRLDDAPNFETLYLITSEKPFTVTRLEPFLKALVTDHESSLQLPTEFSYTAFRIVKKESTR